MSRHTSEWWSKRVRELSRGGDAAQIAALHGVRAQTLLWWQWELARRSREQDGGPRLLPVVVEARRGHTGGTVVDAVEVVVESGGSRMCVRGAVSAEHLSAIVGALARRC
jgi:hypothetical protein